MQTQNKIMYNALKQLAKRGCGKSCSDNCYYALKGEDEQCWCYVARKTLKVIKNGIGGI